MSLHSLIQSMSKSEKRYFKLYAQMGKNSAPKYLKLFDLMNKQETYDEEVVKKKGFNPTDKNLLMEKLLDTIHIMSLHKTVDAELRLMLDYISILFQKKQWQLLGKYIKKAKQMAEENEQFDVLVEVLKWEQILWAYTDKTNIEEKMDKAIERKTAVLEQLNDQVQYYDLSMRVELILRGDSMLKKPTAKKKFNEITNLPLLDETAKPLSARATIDYAYVKLLYHRRREEDEQTLHYCRLLLKVFNENKFLFHLHDYPVFYVKIHFWEKAMCLKLDVETSTTPLQISDFPEHEQGMDLSHTIDIQNITHCIRALNHTDGKQYVSEAEQR